MANLKILSPEGTTNYIKNPSARYDTTGWVANGSTLTRSLDFARFGIASLKVVTNGAALGEGISYRVTALAGISDPITVSVYVIGTGEVRIRLIDNPVGMEWVSQSVTLRTDRWTRLDVTGFSTGSNDLRLIVETDQIKSVTFYVDGAQMERKPYVTTYCDGEQEGCRWNIMDHNSVSVREDHNRAGGRWVELAGRKRTEKDLYMTVAGGLGVAPIMNNQQSYADAPGSYYQNTKILARGMTFTFHAKHEQKKVKPCPDGLEFLHQLRQMLIDLIKPDKTHGGQEFLMEYGDGDFPLYIRARYDGGLEGDWDVRNSWINSFPLRLLAVSPFWYEDNQVVTALDFQEWNTTNFIATRLDGQWGNMNFGFNNTVNDLAFGSRGEVIAVGLFTRANSDVSAIDPLIPTNFIAYWDGTQWNQYGIGANGEIRAVAVAPNGYVYVTGSFTSIGGVAANRVAYWDGSAWNTMGTGLNATGHAIAVAPDGTVYVGGEFTTAGASAAQKIAYWDGGTWQVVGIYGGLNGNVRTLAITPDGITIYVGGEFTDEYTDPGSVVTRAAEYDTVTGLFTTMGDGFASTVYKMKVSPSGSLYAVGSFSLSGTQDILRIARWNGSTWVALGSGINGTVYSLDILASGEVIAVGDFDEAGGVDATGVAIWNGSTWTNLDIVQGDEIYAVLYDEDKNIYLGADSPLHVAGSTTVNNTGSAETNPKLYVAGPALLKFIENQTNHKRVYIDLDILDGEDVFFDFGRGKVTSSIRGDLSYSVLPGSDMRAFTLLPGENRIAALMVDDLEAKLYMSYIPRHWSVDSTARGDEF
ncbi:MAG: hypothetical protein EHM33_01910 [Chloroflexi bacterium]|nr:MAG: hypothetical protein EHM33_01910 [Chloroflexota bacterium]